MLKRILKIIGFIIGAFVLFIVGFFLYERYSVGAIEPTPASTAALQWKVTEPSPGLYKINNNWFRKSESGLYELYTEGAPFERGVVIGKLSQSLVQHQEVAFTNQLRHLVPNNTYLQSLKYFVKWFNRDLPDNVDEEFKLEVFGVSRAASHSFDAELGPAYQRMLYYHAAHDIGHALQNFSLVGCTSFATWKTKSEDGSLIVGRNFDFYLGDEFNTDKIVAFYNPQAGHKFMMVTFGGMTGVLSGMNDQGLTVTINAAKSDIPKGSATPVSLVAREILQYASTIEEAYAIAGKRKMFVSESFLIGSAHDGKAANIEKTPDAIDLVEPKDDFIISTNHFRGIPLGETELNKEHMRVSASPYRYDRVAELLKKDGQNSVLKTARLLRNQLGKQDTDIGMGNEKAVNQLVAHHSIIFQPEKLLVWVSTNPWQLGKYVCYDLKKVFGDPMISNHEIYEPALTIPSDSFLLTPQYRDYVKFSAFRFPFNPRTGMEPDSLTKWNPRSYQAWLLAGDYWFNEKEYAKAIPFYQSGLKTESATLDERTHMEKNLRTSLDKLK